MTGDERYVALIGDIRGSREAEDRAALQERFEEAVEAANEWLDPEEVASPLTITAGDEFQALFDEPRAAVQAISRVSDEMAPTMLRFGLGYGSLETELNQEQAVGMDGPCLQAARDALKKAKMAPGWVRLMGFDSVADSDLEPWSWGIELGVLLDPVGSLRENWTPRQAQFVRALPRHDGVQKDVAQELGVSPSTVSESLDAANVAEVRQAENAAGNILSWVVGEANPP